MPSLVRMAGSFFKNPHQSVPGAGVLLALGLYFLIGAIVAVAFAERNTRQFFLVGISAPALITNIIGGASQTPTATATASLSTPAGAHTSWLTLLPAAHAEPVAAPAASDDTCTLDIRTSTTGVPAGAENELLVSVDFTDKAGRKLPGVTLTPGASKEVKVDVPRGAEAVDISAGGKTAEQRLPACSSQAQVQIQAEGTRDFRWALGASREPSVREIDVSVR